MRNYILQSQEKKRQKKRERDLTGKEETKSDMIVTFQVENWEFIPCIGKAP